MKSPQQIQQENDEITDISLTLMEKLLKEAQLSNKLLKEIKTISEDQAGMLSELLDNFEDGEEEEVE